MLQSIFDQTVTHVSEDTAHLVAVVSIQSIDVRVMSGDDKTFFHSLQA